MPCLRLPLLSMWSGTSRKTTVMTCDKCGGDMLPMVERLPVFIARCRRCGHEVSGAADSRDILRPADPLVQLFVAWRGGIVTAAEVATLRKLFPDVADRSIAAVVASAGGQLTTPLGTFPQWQADELVAKGRALNLDLRYTGMSPRN